MSSVSGSEQEAGKYGQGTAMSQQASADLSVPSSPLLDFNATKLVQHYHAAEYEYMAAQFLAVLSISEIRRITNLRKPIMLHSITS